MRELEIEIRGGPYSGRVMSVTMYPRQEPQLPHPPANVLGVPIKRDPVTGADYIAWQDVAPDQELIDYRRRMILSLLDRFPKLDTSKAFELKFDDRGLPDIPHRYEDEWAAAYLGRRLQKFLEARVQQIENQFEVNPNLTGMSGLLGNAPSLEPQPLTLADIENARRHMGNVWRG